MADPTINRSRVVITYTSSDRYRAEFSAKAPNQDAKTQPEPHLPLLAGLEELARLTALFGFEDEALKVFSEARQRVADWKAMRATPTPEAS